MSCPLGWEIQSSNSSNSSSCCCCTSSSNGSSSSNSFGNGSSSNITQCVDHQITELSLMEKGNVERYFKVIG